MPHAKFHPDPLKTVLLQHFLLIFIIKEAYSMHKIGNNRDLVFLLLKGIPCMAYWHSLEYATVQTKKT